MANLNQPRVEHPGNVAWWGGRPELEKYWKNSHHMFAVGQVNAEGFGGAQQKDQHCLGRGMEILLPPHSRVGNNAWGCYSKVGVIRLGKIFSGAWKSPFQVDSLSRAYEE